MRPRVQALFMNHDMKVIYDTVLLRKSSLSMKNRLSETISLADYKLFFSPSSFFSYKSVLQILLRSLLNIVPLYKHLG